MTDGGGNSSRNRITGSIASIIELFLSAVMPRRKPPKVDGAFDPAQVRLALDRQVRDITGKVPAEVMAKVLSLRQIITGILPSSGNFPPGSLDLYVVERTATNYLPRSLDSYLSLPRLYATQHRMPNGKTPKEILLDQLTLLETKMAEVAQDVHRNDAARLLVHGRFLEDRFGQPPLSLERPPSDATREAGP